jgi:hypothetical protein
MATPLATKEHQHQALQRFVVSNRELAELEALANRFNIFEALDVVRAERQHSCFLGFLLDPGGSHGLGDRLLKLLLQSALQIQPTVAPITPIDIDLLDLSQAEMRLEYESIDILICDEHNLICLIIENKVDSTQHSDQLERYYRIARGYYPKSVVFGIYLTIDGEPSEHEHYVAVSHASIRRMVETVLAIPALHIEQEVQFAIRQYVEVLGRHFMADEQITELCQKIYRQHKQAIDLIIQNMPDARAVIREKLIRLIEANEDKLILDDCTKGFVRFISKELDRPVFHCGLNWTSSKRVFLFEFQISQERVQLIIQMGPGDSAMRKQIHEFALANPKVFRAEKRLYDLWQTLFKKPIAETIDAAIDHSELLMTLESKWDEFLEKDLPRIEKAFAGQAWQATPHAS